MRAIVLVLAMLTLAGCTGQNTNIATLQFSGSSEKLPDNYQVEAARVVATKTVAGGQQVRVSRPQPILGVTAFSPKRWYVCVLGLAGPARPSRIPSIYDAVMNVADPASNAGVYNLVLVFNEGRRPSVKTGYDSPLCRTAAYEPLTAKPPLI
jgi:hypothetical protein